MGLQQLVLFDQLHCVRHAGLNLEDLLQIADRRCVLRMPMVLLANMLQSIVNRWHLGEQFGHFLHSVPLTINNKPFKFISTSLCDDRFIAVRKLTHLPSISLIVSTEFCKCFKPSLTPSS